MPRLRDAVVAGLRYLQAGDSRRAAHIFREVLRQEPRHVEALFYLGNALTDAGDLDEAVSTYRKAISLEPRIAELHNNLGNTYLKQGRASDAEGCYRKALRLAPENALAHNNLGMALARQGRFDEAEVSYRTCLRIAPDYAEAYFNFGNALGKARRLDEAVGCYEAAIRLRPGFAAAYNNLGGVLSDQGKLDEAIASQRQAAVVPEFHSALLHTLNYDPRIDDATLLEEHRRWDQAHGRGLGHGFVRTPGAADDHPARPLRVAYLSADFRAHPIAWFILPILQNHDPAEVEVFCYAEVPEPDAVSERLRALSRGWRSTCGLPDRDVAAAIHRDRIDILVDLSGHTANNRIRVLTLKPAPIQVSWLGYPSTTGLETVDYRITDAVADPPGEPRAHVEELVRLRGSFCCYRPPDNTPPVAPLPASRAGHVTFGSLHNLAKLNGGVLDLWCQVLRAVPSAKLLVFRDSLFGDASRALDERLRARGVAPERFELRRRVESSPAGYLRVYADVDVCLDAQPWSAHTTACEALWMGVPIVTLRGTRFAGRMAASVLAAAGLDQLVAEGPAQFVAIAEWLAGDLNRLVEFRATIRQRLLRSPLCDAAAFTRGLEMAYRNMWQRWLAGTSERP